MYQLSRGIGLAAVAATVNAMLADSIEYGQWKTACPCRGDGFIPASHLAQRLRRVLASAVPLEWFWRRLGYDGLAAEQSAVCLQQLKNMYLLIPAIVLALLPILYSRYKLDGM